MAVEYIIAKYEERKKPITATVLKRADRIMAFKYGGEGNNVFVYQSTGSRVTIHSGKMKVTSDPDNKGYSRYYPMVQDGVTSVTAEEAVRQLNYAVATPKPKPTYNEYWKVIIRKKKGNDERIVYTEDLKRKEPKKSIEEEEREKGLKWLASPEGKTWLSKQTIVKSIPKGWKLAGKPYLVPYPYRVINNGKNVLDRDFKTALIHVDNLKETKSQPRKKAEPKSRATATSQDEKRLAKLPGKRVSATGHVYYESRVNRSDTETERKWHGKKTDQKIRGRGRKPAEKKQAPATPGEKKPLTESQLIAVVKEYAKTIDKAPREHSVFFDKYGNVILHKTGGVSSVSAPAIYYQEAAAHLHNHPSEHGYGHPQSAQDVSLLFTTACPIVMVCSYGKWFMFKKKEHVQKPLVADEIRRVLKKKLDDKGDYLAQYAARANHITMKNKGNSYCYSQLYSDMPYGMYLKLQKRSYLLYESMLCDPWCEIHEDFTKSYLNKYNKTIRFSRGNL